ncbi:MAG: M24 family metallopeptidase [Erysipelotrichaceae bacterium]|jgi:Xaa-Pro aminopeptidase|nr:M24 family metallopeptidase [Erysipelotrichaceae bacterium]
MIPNRKAQEIAKKTMADLAAFITVDMTEKDIFEFATRRMIELGSDAWWYHDIPCLVLSGRRSGLSIGRDYVPDDTVLIQAEDIVTIDLAPTYRGEWGDYARTLVLQKGKVTKSLIEIKNLALRQGVEAENRLHDTFVQLVKPYMTYEEVYTLMNKQITDMGYVNLDFKGNLGHSIERDQSQRIYLEKGNPMRLCDYGKPFTFEPHIQAEGGTYGFKKENIYYFENNHCKAV